jgi:hypothetical protein
MPATFEPIATTTVGTATNMVSFTSIPSTYTDLLLIAACKYNAGGGDLNLQFNSDTGNNYSSVRLLSVGSSASCDVSVNRSNIQSTDTGTNTTTVEAHILNYRNTGIYKNVLINAAGPASSQNAGYVCGSWRNTSAITRVDVRAESTPQWAVGSTFTLYGILGA